MVMTTVRMHREAHRNSRQKRGARQRNRMLLEVGADMECQLVIAWQPVAFCNDRLVASSVGIRRDGFEEAPVASLNRLMADIDFDTFCRCTVVQIQYVCRQ